MIPAGVAANPPGRVLAAWWHQLDARAPRRLWYADLIVRRLDVVVRQLHRTSLDALHRLLLEAIAGFTSSTAAQLPKRLGLNDNVFRLIVGGLVGHGLIRVDESGVWMATDAGRRAAAQGEFSTPRFERQTFHLLASNHAFLPIRAEGMPAALPDNARAALASLRSAVAQPPEWKHRHGFPEEVDEILDLDSPANSPIPAWRRVPFERGERHLLALIQTSNDRVLAFTARLDGTVTGKSPCLELAYSTAAEVLNLSEPDADAWRLSWRNWSQTIRGVSAAEIDACAIERFNHVLRVKLPAELRDRIKVERPEAFKSEAWLLAGESSCRAACLLDLT